MESPLRTAIPSNCRLIETFRFDPTGGALNISLHLKRMAHSAKVFGFPFYEKTIVREIGNLSSKHPLRCRLILGEMGDFNLKSEIFENTEKVWKVAIAEQNLSVHFRASLPAMSTTRAKAFGPDLGSILGCYQCCNCFNPCTWT